MIMVQSTFIINSVGFNNVVIQTGITGGVSNTLLGYLTFGSARSIKNTSVGHPFIM